MKSSKETEEACFIDAYFRASEGTMVYGRREIPDANWETFRLHDTDTYVRKDDLHRWAQGLCDALTKNAK